MKRNRRKEFQSFQYTQLGLSKGSDNDDDDEETELFVIQKPQFKEIATEEKTVQKGDTLQALSIRYHVPIAELKRLNNIHKENEIYARNTLKVPARPFTTILAGIHSGNNSPDNKAQNAATETANSIDTTILENKLTSLNKSDTTDFNTLIFNSNINDSLLHVCDDDRIAALEGPPLMLEEHVQLLPTNEIGMELSAVEPPLVVSKLSCSGADADISWIALIICIVVLIFAVPLIYVFYIAEHPDEFHHKTHNNSLT